VLAPGVLGANNVTRKKPKYEANDIKSMLAPEKLVSETRELEAHLIRKVSYKA